MNIDDARAKATSTYNAAAHRYDDPLNSFWERFGAFHDDRLKLQPGQQVLDVCCGSGASAIPAAEKVGPGGLLPGIDLSEKLLALARAKANERSLRNIEFRVGDMLDLRLPPSHFDAVVCVFGIFFVPDMVAAGRALWHLVRPGGQLAITTWGLRFFEPATTAFWNSIREVRPDLYKGFNPWDRISEPDALLSLFRRPESNMEKLAPKRDNIQSPRPKHGGLPFSVPAIGAPSINSTCIIGKMFAWQT